MASIWVSLLVPALLVDLQVCVCDFQSIFCLCAVSCGVFNLRGAVFGNGVMDSESHMLYHGDTPSILILNCHIEQVFSFYFVKFNFLGI